MARSNAAIGCSPATCLTCSAVLQSWSELSIGISHASGDLPGFARGLYLGVFSQAVCRFLDFANQVFRCVFDAILVDHGFSTSPAHPGRIAQN
jgi:hypothetical protein